jgi:MFS family permease
MYELGAGIIALCATLMPLRIHALGGSSTVVGLVFILAALGRLAAAPAIGSLVDRVGRDRPMLAGATLTALFLALLPVARAVWLFAAVAVALVGVSWTARMIPGAALVVESAHLGDLSVRERSLLLLLCFLIGEVSGALVSGALAQVAGLAVACIAAAALVLACVLASGRRKVKRPVASTRCCGDVAQACPTEWW